MELPPEGLEHFEDVDELWQGLQEAKAAADHQLVRAIENRMRELGPQRRFAHLSDDELDQQIAGMTAHREPTGMIGHSPGGGGFGAGDAGVADLQQLNHAHRQNQHDGVEVTLEALLAERRRRSAS